MSAMNTSSHILLKNVRNEYFNPYIGKNVHNKYFKPYIVKNVHNEYFKPNIYCQKCQQ